MTTDDFTTAARTEAEEYAWDRNAGTTHEDSLDRDAFASGYEYGAFWARAHLAAQEPTLAEVTAAIHAYDSVVEGLGGDYAPGTAIRAALFAARKARS